MAANTPSSRQGLNLPLDVVDTGFSEKSFSARIEDDAGIDIAMCFSREDAVALIASANRAPALLAALEQIANEEDERDEWGGTEKFVRVREIARAALTAATGTEPTEQVKP